MITWLRTLTLATLPEHLPAAGYRGWVQTNTSDLRSDLPLLACQLSLPLVAADQAASNCQQAVRLAQHLLLRYRKQSDLPMLELVCLSFAPSELGTLCQQLNTIARAVCQVSGLHTTLLPDWGNPLAQVDVLRTVLAQTDPDYVGLSLDTAAYFNAGGDPAECFYTYPRRVWNVYLRDVGGNPPMPVPLGTGLSNWRETIMQLARFQYQRGLVLPDAALNLPACLGLADLTG